MRYLLFFALTLWLSLHCKPTDRPLQQQFDCYVRFDAQSKQLRAEAQLLEGDSAKPVAPPDGMRYQRSDMTLLPMQGLRYLHTYPGAYLAEHVFDWKDAQGQPHQFILKMPDAMTSYGFEPAEIAHNRPATFRWVGKPLEKGETLLFLWENAATDVVLPMELTTVGPQSVIEFPAKKLAELRPGNWTYTLVRKSLHRAESPGLRMSGTGEYYTAPVPMVIR